MSVRLRGRNRLTRVPGSLKMSEVVGSQCLRVSIRQEQEQDLNEYLSGDSVSKPLTTEVVNWPTHLVGGSKMFDRPRLGNHL